MWPSRVRHLAKRCRRDFESCEPPNRGGAEGSDEYCKMQIANIKLQIEDGGQSRFAFWQTADVRRLR
jgi:hypothetical protein